MEEGLTCGSDDGVHGSVELRLVVGRLRGRPPLQILVLFDHVATRHCSAGLAASAATAASAAAAATAAAAARRSPHVTVGSIVASLTSHATSGPDASARIEPGDGTRREAKQRGRRKEQGRRTQTKGWPRLECGMRNRQMDRTE